MKKTLQILLFSITIMILAAAAEARSVKLVVNGSNNASSITKAKAADLFLKRVTRWDSGKTVTPVDLSEKNSSRSAFCRELLGKEVAWVKSYWQKMIFSGRATPPAELSSEGEVLDFVRNNADAVGYVSDSATLPAGVRVLAVTD